MKLTESPSAAAAAAAATANDLCTIVSKTETKQFSSAN